MPHGDAAPSHASEGCRWDEGSTFACGRRRARSGAPLANTRMIARGAPRPHYTGCVDKSTAPNHGPLILSTSHGCKEDKRQCQEDLWCDLPQTDPERIPRRPPWEQPDDIAADLSLTTKTMMVTQRRRCAGRLLGPQGPIWSPMGPALQRRH